jgi:hypothetical protein
MIHLLVKVNFYNTKTDMVNKKIINMLLDTYNKKCKKNVTIYLNNCM